MTSPSMQQEVQLANFLPMGVPNEQTKTCPNETQTGPNAASYESPEAS